MSLPTQPNAVNQPEWLTGRGLGPKATWRLGTDGTLTALAYARESGAVFIADSSPAIYQASRTGQIQAMIRQKAPLRSLVWSDNGAAGAAIQGNATVLRLDPALQMEFALDLPDTCLSIAISPYGNHIAVGLANGLNLIYNERKRRIAQFQTVRPLAFMRFCTTEPLLIAAAEHGLLCCHDLQGGEVWQERLWSNVGALEMTGDADLVYLAGFSHGIQTFDGDGAPVGSYVLDGTVNRLAVSFEPQRLLAATFERQLYWLDADGELLWATTPPDDVSALICDPLGEWGLVGFNSEGVYRLDWG